MPNLRKKTTFWDNQSPGIKAIVREQQTDQEPGRNVDIVKKKAMAEMTMSRDMSSNEHETNSTKKHIDN